MGFWANWKEKRKKENEVVETNKKPKTSNNSKKKTESVSATALEENENQKFNHPILDNIDNEIQKTHQQQIDDLIEDPHIHSQGFISPKQGVHVFVDEVVDNSNLEKKLDSEKKKKNKSSTKRIKEETKRDSKKS